MFFTFLARIFHEPRRHRGTEYFSLQERIPISGLDKISRLPLTPRMFLQSAGTFSGLRGEDMLKSAWGKDFGDPPEEALVRGRA